METPLAVRIRDLRKTYFVSEREPGVRAALKSLVHQLFESLLDLGTAQAALFLVASRLFWRAGIRRYSGASA